MVVSLNSRLESDQEADKYGLFMQFHRISRRGVSDPPSSPGRFVNSFQSLYLETVAKVAGEKFRFVGKAISPYVLP